MSRPGHRRIGGKEGGRAGGGWGGRGGGEGGGGGGEGGGGGGREGTQDRGLLVVNTQDGEGDWSTEVCSVEGLKVTS